MKNSERLIGRMMLVGAVIFGGGLTESNSKSNQQSPTPEEIERMGKSFDALKYGLAPQGVAPASAPSLTSWAEVLEQNPDPKVVTDADFRKRIVESKLPWRVRDKKSGMEMLLVPPGKFVMGMSPGDQEGVELEEYFANNFPEREYSERPAHEVTITKAFYFGKTEVTQAQWVKVMQSNPSKNQGSSGHPVEGVSWNDCQKFCAATGLRLPTEAEWEYACRAGVHKSRYGKLAEIAWFAENSAQTTHPVGKKLPNALGFYDILGNVEEWCNDYFQGDYYKDCIDGVVDPKGPSSGPCNIILQRMTTNITYSGRRGRGGWEGDEEAGTKKTKVDPPSTETHTMTNGVPSRVLRGGAWGCSSHFCRGSPRNHTPPNSADGAFGFRSARTP